MASLVLYIATSLDGFIARADGSLDWLTRFESAGTDYGYREFYGTVGALLMGRKTYDAALSLGPWPNQDRPCYVLTHLATELPHVTALSGPLPEIVPRLQLNHDRVWLVGGGSLVSQALRNHLLDEIIVSIMPVLLGDGIPLVGETMEDVRLNHIGTKSYDGGVMQLTYRPVYSTSEAR